MSTNQPVKLLTPMKPKSRPKITPTQRKKMIAGIRRHHRQLRGVRIMTEKAAKVGKYKTIVIDSLSRAANLSDSYKRSRKPSLQEVQKALRILERAGLL